MCGHGVRKDRCRPCGGGGICEHGVRKACCRPCGGGAICEHGKVKQACRDCNNCLCDIPDCPLYAHRFAGVATLLGHMRSAHSDHPKALTKTKELAMYQALQPAGVQFEYQLHIPFRSCGIGSETAYAYPDFVITMPWGSLILECDETQHTHYPSACDVRRDFDICASVALGSAEKLVIFRYNPGDSHHLSKGSRGKAVVDYHHNGGARRHLHQALSLP